VSLRARHLARLTYNLVVAGRREQARAMLAEARSTVRASGDAGALFTLGLTEGALEYYDGQLGRSLEMIEGAVRAGLGAGEDAAERVAQLWRSEVLAALDRPEESLRLEADGVASAQHDRQAWALHLFETWRGRRLLQMGRLADAAAALQGRFGPKDVDSVVGVHDAAGVAALARVALHTGDALQTRQTAAIARAMLEQSAPSLRRHGAWLLALHAMAEGDPVGSRGWLCALGEEERKWILPLQPMDATDDVQLVRIAIAAEDDELAESAVAAAERRSELSPDVRSIAAAAAHARGLLSGSYQELARAAELLDDGPRPLALASALEDLALAGVEGGASEDGVEALGRALVLYDRAGATWDVGRVRARLRALGVRRRLVSTERPERGWAAMTDSELAVARLVAQGHTNREVAEQLFVSPHTVNTHLRQVFAKLEVNSRVELARLAVEQDALA
jgi:DNA-binding CsgD family transcriptional regulator